MNSDLTSLTDVQIAALCESIGDCFAEGHLGVMQMENAQLPRPVEGINRSVSPGELLREAARRLRREETEGR